MILVWLLAQHAGDAGASGECYLRAQQLLRPGNHTNAFGNEPTDELTHREFLRSVSGANSGGSHAEATRHGPPESAAAGLSPSVLPRRSTA